MQILKPIPKASPEALVERAQDVQSSGERYTPQFQRLAAQMPSGKHTLVLAGYGATLRVERDCLIVQEGHTHSSDDAQRHALYRGRHGVSTITCLDVRGSLLFEALNWARSQGITLLTRDHSCNVVATITLDGDASDSALCRCQYLASPNGADVVVAHENLRRKPTSQRATIQRFFGDAHALDALNSALEWLTTETLPPWLNSIEMVRSYEGRTAHAYFEAWKGFFLRWAKPDLKKFAPHWLTFADRSSPLALWEHARRAVSPVNAVLNYAYALLEAQARLALIKLGFDLSCSFLHVDRRFRDTLAFDVMDCAQGDTDAPCGRFHPSFRWFSAASPPACPCRGRVMPRQTAALRCSCTEDPGCALGRCRDNTSRIADLYIRLASFHTMGFHYGSPSHHSGKE
jgi:CRISPR/Cas system-associated endonuclease Cas1